MEDTENTNSEEIGEEIDSLDIGNRKFSLTDKMILHSFETAVDAIADLYGENCEVVLYSLEQWDSAVVKVVNGHVTGRTVKSPLTNLEINLLRKIEKTREDVVGSYFVRKENGEMIKSSKAIIRNFEDQPIGMLSINLNLSAPFFDIISRMVPAEENIAPVKPIRYPASPHELVKQSLEIVMSQLRNSIRLSQLERNRQVVLDMFNIGIFNIKGAVDIVANEMGVSRYTIYNYIREAKNAQKS